MKTIYSIRDGQPRYDTVCDCQVAKKIKMLKKDGWQDVRIVPCKAGCCSTSMVLLQV